MANSHHSEAELEKPKEDVVLCTTIPSESKKINPKSWRAATQIFTTRDNLHESDRSTEQARPWTTTLLQFGPLSGIFAMFLALASIVGALGILVGSNGQPVSSWSSPPSTYLAIFTAIANLSVRYSAIQGVTIAWWSRALKGSTLSKIHWLVNSRPVPSCWTRPDCGMQTNADQPVLRK